MLLHSEMHRPNSCVNILMYLTAFLKIKNKMKRMIKIQETFTVECIPPAFTLGTDPPLEQMNRYV